MCESIFGNIFCSHVFASHVRLPTSICILFPSLCQKLNRLSERSFAMLLKDQIFAIVLSTSVIEVVVILHGTAVRDLRSS